MDGLMTSAAPQSSQASYLAVRGVLEHTPRGLLLRMADGHAWRLDFGDQQVPVDAGREVEIRGWLVASDRIRVEFCTDAPD